MQYKTIHLHYYALLREQIGKTEEDFTTAAMTAKELYDEIQDRYHFGFREDLLKVSINDVFTSWQTKLKAGDRVVFIPPVSGG